MSAEDLLGAAADRREGRSRDDARPQQTAVRSRWVIASIAGLLVAGFAAWALGAGFVAFWCFVAASVVIALVLPLPYALLSPLYMGAVGWLVDMFPFLILVGWGTVVLRWAAGLVVAKRLPRGGMWTWIPILLVAWTALGVVVVEVDAMKHFALLFGMQVLISGGVLAIVDAVSTHEARVQLAVGLVSFVVLLSTAVFLQWTGVNIQALQDVTISERLEAAYGLDTFPNNTGMIKYTRAKEAGGGRLRKELNRLERQGSGLPPFEVFRPRFKAFENNLVVRFTGSARATESELERLDVRLIYDNVGLAPMETVPRLRSLPRNALTYAGICAAAFPLALYLAWSQTGRRRRLGQLGVAACLFGAGFSIARGAWVAILLGIVYLLFDTVLSRRRKVQAVLIYFAGAAVLTAVFLVKYHSDPLTARALGESSVTTREQLYTDTLESVTGLNLVIGYGIEQPRTASGGTRLYGEYGRYIPPAGTHSTYLNYFFRAGVVGLGGIIALYVIAWLHARAAGRIRSGSSEAMLSTLACVAVVIAAAHATILSLYVEPAYTLAITLVLGIALARSTSLPTSVLPWRSRQTTTGGEASPRRAPGARAAAHRARS